VIFVPSHRSYADFILMSLMCFTEDLAIPAIAAGMGKIIPIFSNHFVFYLS
jgi:glycerol-3-phosphate O-acyltransferase